MKLIKIVFVFLLLIVLAEMGYFFYISKVRRQNEIKNEAENKNKAIFIESAKTNSKEYRELAKTAEPAIHPKMLDRLKNYIKSPEGRLYILSEQTTQVLQIAKDGATVEDWRDGKLYPGKIFFPYALKLANKVMPEGYIWIFFHEPVIKKTNVYFRSKDGALKKATLEDIRVGDTVTMIEKWDPSVEPDMNNLKDFLAKQIVEGNIYIEK